MAKGYFIWPAQCLEIGLFCCPFLNQEVFFKGWIWLHLLAAGSASGLWAGHALVGSVHCFKGHYLLTSPDHPASYITFWSPWVFGIHGPYSSALFCYLHMGKPAIQRSVWCSLGVRLSAGV